MHFYSVRGGPKYLVAKGFVKSLPAGSHKKTHTRIKLVFLLLLWSVALQNRQKHKHTVRLRPRSLRAIFTVAFQN